MKTMETQKDEHNKFGGVVYLSDFDTENRGNDAFSGSVIANRIFSDWCFDKQCRLNEEGRDRKMRKSQEKASKSKLENSVACHPGYYLRKVIVEKEYTHEEFAKEIGISSIELERLLSGERDLSANIIKNLAKLLGTTTEYWIDIQNRYNDMAGKERMNVQTLV